MLAKLIDKSSNADNHEEQLIEISSKLSNYEDLIYKLSIKDTHIHPLSLQITEILSKLSAYKNLLDKLSISNINKFEAEMKEHEEIPKTKTNTKINGIKSEASISINQTFSPPDSHNSHFSSNQS